MGLDCVKQSHYSLVYGSSVEVDIDFTAVRDVCFLKFFPTGADDELIENWCEAGPNRFFFQHVSSDIHFNSNPCSGLMQAPSSLRRLLLLFDWLAYIAWRPASPKLRRGSLVLTYSLAVVASLRGSNKLG